MAVNILRIDLRNLSILRYSGHWPGVQPPLVEVVLRALARRLEAHVDIVQAAEYGVAGYALPY